MLKKKLLLSCAVAGLALGGMGFTAAQAQNVKEVHNFAIQSGSLEEALISLSRQSAVQIIASGDMLAGKETAAYHQMQTTAAALDSLLQGTNLTYRLQGDNTVLILDKTGFQPIGLPSEKDYLKNLGDYEGDLKKMEEMQNFLFDEIIVTASKRATNLQDTVMALTHIGTEAMDKRNLVGIGDYLNSVPGVTLVATSVGNTDVTIRGLGNIGGLTANGNTDPSVARYFGEAPISSVQSTSRSSDVKLVDMARVEVLRGPQGTLWGANALTGIIRNIPNAPNLSEFEGNIELGYSKTARGGDDNTKLTGVINVPLVEDKLALRVVAYQFKEGGYVDNIAPESPVAVAKTVRDGGSLRYHANEGGVKTEGVRATVLWEPNADLSVSLMYLWQKEHQSGNNSEDTGFAPYTNARYPVGDWSEDGWAFNEDQINLANLAIEYDLGWGSLFSSTSWSEGGFNQVTGWSSTLNLAKYGRVQDNPKARKALVEEIRLQSQFDGPFQFITGYFFMDAEDSNNVNFVWMGDSDLYTSTSVFGLPLQTTGYIGFSNIRDSIKQHAVFGEVSYDIIEDLTVTFGARYYDYERVTESGNTFFSPSRLPPPNIETTKQNGTVLKANISYKPTEDSMIYAQWGQGFRLGKGVSDDIDPLTRAVCDVNNDDIVDGTGHVFGTDLESDSTNNYELGAKASFMDKRVTVNAAVYQIDWTNLPLNIFSPSPLCLAGFPGNGGKAVSRGIEVETTIYLTDALRLDVSGSYNDAKLAIDIPAVGAVKGDRVPSAADFNGSVALEYQFDVAGHDSYINGNYYYISEFYSDLAKTLGPIGGYGILGFSAGMNFGDIDVKVYGRNLTNENDFTSVLSTIFIRLRPRVVGVELGYSF